LETKPHPGGRARRSSDHDTPVIPGEDFWFNLPTNFTLAGTEEKERGSYAPPEQVGTMYLVSLSLPTQKTAKLVIWAEVKDN